MMNEAIKLLAGGISAIIPPEYIGQKLIESGTGILWKKLKKRLEGDNNAVGAGLYDAIEHSVEVYANTHTHNKDDIAVCCEKLYFEWMKNNSLKDDSIKKALSTLSAQPIGEVQVETWKSFLDREILKNDELRNWIEHKSIENISSKLDCIRQEIKEMPASLKRREILENMYNIFEDDEYKIYIKNMHDAYRESVMGESFGLNKIYIDLHAIICDNIEHTDKKVENVAEYICKWLKDKQYSNDIYSNSMLLVYGEPGSGKSSVLKKVVDELTNGVDDKKTIVLSLNLFEVTFVDAKTALDVVKQYIKNGYPWFYEADNRLDRILILDGLDEIKYKVYEKSQELLRELEGEKWKFDCKVIVSGRTQAVRKAKENIYNYINVEILPLYIDIYERKKYIDEVVDENNLLEIDLRLDYWDKLQKEFNIIQNMPLQNSRFDEISRQPLLLFLIMWTAKYSNINLMELKNTAELYNKIFECIYTREYSRKKAGGLKYKAEYSEYQKMLAHLGGCAYRNNSRSVSANTIYEYCTVMEQNSLDEINKIIQNATQYWDDSDYKSCLILLKNSKVRSTDIETLYSQYSDKYVLILLSQADSLISQRKYEDAVKILEDGKILVNDEKMIVSKIDDIKNSRPIKLSDIKLTSSRFFIDNEGKSLIDTVGNKYATGNSFITYAEGKTKCGYGTFYLGKKYTSLSGIIAVSDESEDREDIQLQGWVEIGTKSNDKDFNSLWSSQILSRTTSSIEIPELNLKGSEWLEIRYYNNGEYYSLAKGYHSLKIILANVMLYVD